MDKGTEAGNPETYNADNSYNVETGGIFTGSLAQTLLGAAAQSDYESVVLAVGESRYDDARKLANQMIGDSKGVDVTKFLGENQIKYLIGVAKGADETDTEKPIIIAKLDMLGNFRTPYLEAEEILDSVDEAKLLAYVGEEGVALLEDVAERGDRLTSRFLDISDLAPKFLENSYRAAQRLLEQESLGSYIGHVRVAILEKFIVDAYDAITYQELSVTEDEHVARKALGTNIGSVAPKQEVENSGVIADPTKEEKAATPGFIYNGADMLSSAVSLGHDTRRAHRTVLGDIKAILLSPISAYNTLKPQEKVQLTKEEKATLPSFLMSVGDVVSSIAYPLGTNDGTRNERTVKGDVNAVKEFLQSAAHSARSAIERHIVNENGKSTDDILFDRSAEEHGLLGNVGQDAPAQDDQWYILKEQA